MSAQSIVMLPVTHLKGVGSALAAKLARRNLYTLQDLVFHLPRRYEDRSRITAVGEIQPGMECQIEGQIHNVSVGFGRRRSLQCTVFDGTGSLTIRFFHFSSYQRKHLENSARIRCFGEVNRGAKGLEMYHPEYRTLAVDELLPIAQTLTPIYPVTEGISQLRIRELINRALDHVSATAMEDHLAGMSVKSMTAISLLDAIEYLHNPPVDASQDELQAGVHPAQRRLSFEELLAHHLSLLISRRKIKKNRALPLINRDGLLEKFTSSIGFELTGAQNSAFKEIAADVREDQPMSRLLQGDVGSGKTVVAALTTVLASANGVQTALMAPTELLAEQHMMTFSAWFSDLGIQVAWLAGKLKGQKRKQQLELIAEGVAQVIIGTHAIFQHDVEFARLGLIIIDEQHKFGVHQRLALREKAVSSGSYPHQLVMTATPIPRTLTMSIYADLDCSVIDELPPGRLPVTTAVISDRRRDDVIQRVAEACTKGRQVYWVCTLIEESDVLTSQAAATTADELQSRLPHLKIGLIHGRLPADQKKNMMANFASGEIAVLVATTVIEVGVDVPRASLMIIENPERLGLAQLHQLRGRIGRGSEESHCVLMYKSPLGVQSRQRLNILRETNDGFKIAEEDLRIRGPGEVLGTRQTGEVSFRIADLLRDENLLPEIRSVARRLLDENPVQAQAIIDRWLGSAHAYSHV